MSRSSLRALFAAAWLGFVGFGAAAQDFPVYAAASTREALDEIAVNYRGLSGRHATRVYGSSGTLARQIESGAPAWVFLSADVQWMDHLEKAGLLIPGTRSNLLGNELVLIAPVSSKVKLELGPKADLAKALGKGRLAIGHPDHVPAGRYAKAALGSLGVWDSVEGQLAPMDNVRSTLALVARGEAPLGIVYKTDALAEKKVRVVATFPADSHPPIFYPVALLKGASNQPYAERFLKFLRLPPGRQSWEKHGFRVLP